MKNVLLLSMCSAGVVSASSGDLSETSSPEDNLQSTQVKSQIISYSASSTPTLGSQETLVDVTSKTENLCLHRPSEETYVPSLHIYGGGIRGIIPATFLRAIQEDIKKNPADLFEFFSGTSTGGILTGIMNMGTHTAADIVELYKEKAPEIFTPQYCVNPYGIRGPKYDINNLRKVVAEYIPESHTIADFQKDILFPMYDIRGSTTVIMQSWNARQNESHNFFTIDALCGTAAVVITMEFAKPPD
jgi:hypothetical protein